MNVLPTALPEVLLIQPRVHGDARGFFLENFSEKRYSEVGVLGPFVQDNHSRSAKGVLRGLHYQLPHSQGKLVRASQGQVVDVAVDVRRGSPRFGQSMSHLLDDEKNEQLYIPPGFAHGFVVVSERADFEYKCTDYYHPECEFGVLWNDPALGIDWGFEAAGISVPQLSPKDEAWPKLEDCPEDRLPVYEGADA